tara:strand:+ start:456 stop:1154 length:699 start_codon:yes stop_codon:yes gene_type:complete
MSDNRLNHDNSNKLIKQQRNCIDFEGNKQLNLHYKTMNHDDKCFVDVHTRQSLGPGNYRTSNHYDCECLMPDTVKTATNLPMVHFKNGHDVGACAIDDSTQLRVGLTRKYPRCPQQLFTRPYLTVPYMGKGPGDMDIESQLTPGEPTTSKRQCNTLSGITIPHQFTPLVDHLEYNVQNPEHLVEEVADDTWIRGGAPSRLVVRDIDYLERCGYQYMDKETNQEFWKDKHHYL